MKIVKKICTLILSIIFIFLLIFLSLISTLEEITLNSFNENLVKPQIKEEIITIIENKYPNFNEEKLNELSNVIMNDPDIDNITKKYIDNIIQTILSNRDIPFEQTKEDIISIIEKLNLSDSQKEKIINEINSTNTTIIYKEIETKVKSNITENDKKIIKIYNFLISNIAKICVLILLLLIVLLIILLSNYFMLNLGINLFISTSFIFSIIPKYIYKILNKFSILSKNLEINFKSLYRYGYLYYIIGAVFIIIHIIIMIIRRSKKCS